MRLGLVVAPLLISATAYAQAPGEVDPTTPPAYEEPTPVASNPCGGGRDVMRNRIGIGINIGGFSAANPDAAEGEPTTDFSTAELAIRYRMSPRFELELLLSGGRQVLEDGNDGDLAMGGGTLGLRYRFRPNRAWDWWLGAGLGMTVIERHDSTEEERDAAARPHVAFGVGLERRWNRFALHADLRMMAIGERADSEEAVPVDGGVARLPADIRGARELSAGVFTLGASFHF